MNSTGKSKKQVVKTNRLVEMSETYKVRVTNQPNFRFMPIISKDAYKSRFDPFVQSPSLMNVNH